MIQLAIELLKLMKNVDVGFLIRDFLFLMHRHVAFLKLEVKVQILIKLVLLLINFKFVSLIVIALLFRVVSF